MISYSKWLEPHDALFLICCRTHFMFQKPQYNHFLTIILHRNGFGTQVQWHFLSDGGVVPGSKMSRDHERQMVPCVPPGKGQKTAVGKTDTEKWNTAPRDPLTLESEKQKKAQECGWRIGAGLSGGTWTHPLCFQRDFNQPNTFYVLKTGSLYQITPPNGASCTNLLNPNIKGFFSTLPQVK